MQTYFFHTVFDRVEVDADGTMLPDRQTARLQAAAFAGQIMRDQPACVWQDGGLRVGVTDPSGALLFTIVVTAVNSTCAPEKPATANDP